VRERIESMCANKKRFLREMPILDEPEQRWNTDLTDETDRTDFYRRELILQRHFVILRREATKNL